MKPWKVPLAVQAAPGNTTIYPWRRNGGTQWLGWNTDVDVVQSPVAEDSYERIYYTGDGVPKIKGWDGGEVTKNMERPTATAPTVATASYLSDAIISANMVVTERTITNFVTGFGIITPGPATTVADQVCVFLGTRKKSTGTEIGFTVPAHAVATSAYGVFGPNIAISYTFKWGADTIVPHSGFDVTAVGTITLDDPEHTTAAITYGGYQTSLNYSYPTTASLGAHEVWIPIEKFVGTSGWPSSPVWVYYVQTLLDAWGMEGPPSPVSNEIMVNPGEYIVISDLGDAQGCAKRRFYRSAAGASEDSFYFTGECDSGDTTFNDEKSDAQLAEELPLCENPPTGLTGIVMMPGGWAAGFVGREICFSSLYMPWSWPTEYRVASDFKVVGLGVAGNDLYVMTEGTPYLVTGYHPESLSVSKIAVAQSCVAKRSIATMDRMILYACPDGVQSLMGGSGALLTDKFYDRTAWQAITPSGIIAGVNDRRYYCFHSTGGVVFKFADGADTVTTTDQITTGVYSDLIDDTMYLIQAGNINSWNRGATNLTMLWQSKEFASNRREVWSAARIFGETYPLTLRLYGEGNLMATITVNNQSSFRLPKMEPYRTWSFSLESTGYIDFSAIGTSMSELISGGK